MLSGVFGILKFVPDHLTVEAVFHLTLCCLLLIIGTYYNLFHVLVLANKKELQSGVVYPTHKSDKCNSVCPLGSCTLNFERTGRILLIS